MGFRGAGSSLGFITVSYTSSQRLVYSPFCRPLLSTKWTNMIDENLPSMFYLQSCPPDYVIATPPLQYARDTDSHHQRSS